MLQDWNLGCTPLFTQLRSSISPVSHIMEIPMGFQAGCFVFCCVRNFARQTRSALLSVCTAGHTEVAAPLPPSLPLLLFLFSQGMMYWFGAAYLSYFAVPLSYWKVKQGVGNICSQKAESSFFQKFVRQEKSPLPFAVVCRSLFSFMFYNKLWHLMVPSINITSIFSLFTCQWLMSAVYSKNLFYAATTTAASHKNNS